MKKIFFAAALIFAAAALTAAQTDSAHTVPTNVRAGQADLAAELFQSAVSEAEVLMLSAPEMHMSSSLRSKFYEAAVLFEQAASVNPQYLYNAGTAYWWAGDYVRAAVSLRRHLEKNPFDHKALSNLQQVRVSAKTEKPSSAEISGRPISFILMCAGAFFAGLSMFAAGLVFFIRGKRWSKTASVFAASAVLFFISAAAVHSVRRPFIVAAQESYGYKGDSAVYDVYPAEPWKAGQEMILIETRGNWVLARCGGRESWLPTSSVIFVQQQSRR